MSLGLYLRRALELPPHVAAGKAVQLAMRRTRQEVECRRDLWRATYPADAVASLARRIELSAADVPYTWGAGMQRLCGRYIAHEFDLLGSGWVRVRHGLRAAGVEGHAYPPARAVQADADGEWLAGRVSEANLPEAQRLWRMIDATYEPIDWQIDFKSGYRWDERSHFRRLSFGQHPGADVKVPWELARLQHLPQLAVAHILAKSGQPGWHASDVYARELRNQILDFLATNPPRFGVNWLCPMDVGIRAANILLAVDLLRAGGWTADAPFERAVGLAALAHGRLIAKNLEWSTAPRSNHYLANLAGLLFCSAYLPPTPETDGWLAFAAQQLDEEILCQFFADGGNFEGSTSYHRLSLEIAAFSTALLLGLRRGPRSAPDVWPDWCAHIVAGGSASRAGRRAGEGTEPLSDAAGERLELAAAAAGKWMKPNGCPAQIGDNDSGRLFRMHPSINADAPDEPENPLDHRHLLDAAEALFAAPRAPRWLDAGVIRALTGGRSLRRRAKAPQGSELVGDEESLVRLSEEIARLDPASVRVIELPLPRFDQTLLRRHALNEFGLFVFASDETFISLRCAPQPPFANTMGHTHDDNLALEVHHQGADLIADPGSYLYTPAPALRDLYRGAAAHFAPRPARGTAAANMPALFLMQHRATARCVYFGPLGAGALLEGPGWRTYRVLRLARDKIVITDGCTNGPLSPLHRVPMSRGYGRVDRASLSVADLVIASAQAGGAS